MLCCRRPLGTWSVAFSESRIPIQGSGVCWLMEVQSGQGFLFPAFSSPTFPSQIPAPVSPFTLCSTDALEPRLVYTHGLSCGRDYHSATPTKPLFVLLVFLKCRKHQTWNWESCFALCSACFSSSWLFPVLWH